ncbi:MAG: hypothetical protein PSY12_13975 [bacterium]|nr:hypothetical protein [bacterium]
MIDTVQHTPAERIMAADIEIWARVERALSGKSLALIAHDHGRFPDRVNVVSLHDRFRATER